MKLIHVSRLEMLYRFSLYVSILGFGVGLFAHIGAWFGHVMLPVHSWHLIVGLTAAATCVLSLWRRMGKLKTWVKDGPRWIRYTFAILSIQAIAYLWLEELIRVVPASAPYASRPVLIDLVTMTANEYEVFRARMFSAILMYLFFISVAQTVTILRNSTASAAHT